MPDSHGLCCTSPPWCQGHLQPQILPMLFQKHLWKLMIVSFHFLLFQQSLRGSLPPLPTPYIYSLQGSQRDSKRCQFMSLSCSKPSYGSPHLSEYKPTSLHSLQDCRQSGPTNPLTLSFWSPHGSLGSSHPGRLLAAKQARHASTPQSSPWLFPSWNIHPADTHWASSSLSLFRCLFRRPPSHCIST